MKERLEIRLEQLRKEYENGQRILANLKRQEISLRETLLRIGGAIQLLEEELGESTDSNKVGEEENAD